MARLRDNLARLQLEAETVVADAAEWSGGPDGGFDGILLDAPCTSTGTIRRHPDVAWLRQEAEFAPLTALQRRLLRQAVTLLRPGGTLVYCTCSLEAEEGEEAIAELLASEAAVRRAPVEASEVANLADIVTAQGDLRTLPCHLPNRGPPLWRARRLLRCSSGKNLTLHLILHWISPTQALIRWCSRGCIGAISGLKGCGNDFPLTSRQGVSAAQRRRISTLIMDRFARSMMARATGGSVALSQLWPGRTDRLIIAPHDLRTADATRAAEIYAGRFVFAGKIVTCHGRSMFDLEPPSEDWEVALLGFGWLRHLRAADTALTRANARALVDDWISNSSHSRPIARRADVMSRRVISLLSQAPLVLGDTDGKFYRRYLRWLTREIRYLRYAMVDIPDGVPRLQVMIALCYASLCLANQARHVEPPRGNSPTNCSARSCPTADTSRAIRAR